MRYLKIEETAQYETMDYFKYILKNYIAKLDQDHWNTSSISMPHLYALLLSFIKKTKESNINLVDVFPIFLYWQNKEYIKTNIILRILCIDFQG